PDVLQEFPDLEELIRLGGVRSQISLPLSSKGKLLGVLNLNKAEVYTPSEDELRLLTLIAERIAIALENAKLYQRERWRARREAVLGTIGRALSRTLEVEGLLQEVLRELLQALELDLGAVYLIKDGEFVLLTHRGLSPEFARAAKRNPLDHPILGRVIRSQEPLEVHEFSSPEAKKEGLKHAAYISLAIRGRPIGVLIVGDRTGRMLTLEEIKLLKDIGFQLGLALEQVGLHRETVELQERYRLLKEFNEEILKSVPIGIVRLDREGRILYENPAMRRILGVPGERSKSKALGLKITELPNVKEAELVSRLEGLLAGKGFKGLEISFTSLYGKEAVLSVAGIPLFGEEGRPDGAVLLVQDISLMKAAERLRRGLLDVAEKILASYDIEHILRLVARAIIDHSPFQRAAVSLYDITAEKPLESPVMRIYSAGLTEEEEKELIARGGMPPQYRKAAFSEEFRLGNSYYIPHDRVPWGPGEGIPGRVKLDGWHPNDFLFIPLQGERGIIGHISVDDPTIPQAPTREMLEPLEVFAGLAALAIERAAHLEEIQHQKERLKGIYNISYELVKESNLDELLQKVLKIIEEDFDYDYAAIMLADGQELEVVAERLRFQDRDERSFLGRRFALGEGLSGWAAQHRKPVLVNDCSQDPRFIKSYEGIQSELVVPLLF
ncbi:TPA: GAF domain-containing protein, partial [Candidatus Bipolaricaulota bacterium]|nr:GAF domain-containing protein [Candidatus Bipolaricaulota bacterium]